MHYDGVNNTAFYARARKLKRISTPFWLLSAPTVLQRLAIQDFRGFVNDGWTAIYIGGVLRLTRNEQEHA